MTTSLPSSNGAWTTTRHPWLDPTKGSTGRLLLSTLEQGARGTRKARNPPYLRRSLGGYTRGSASAPPRILGTHEDTKASKASTNTNLRGLKPHSCEGSGATVGHLQKGYPNLGPKLLSIKARDDINLAPQPSKGPPSLRVLGIHPARGKRPPSSGWFPSRLRLGGLEGDPHPRAGGFRLVRGSAASRATPTLERVVSLELAIQARAGLAGNDARRTTTSQSHDDAVKKQGSLLRAITCSPEKTSWTLSAMLHARPNPASSTATSKETMERRTQAATLDVVNRHEKEGRYVSPCHVVSRVGRRDSRSHSARSSSPSPTLLVNPYYKQHLTRCIAPLLDVRPSGRNQDKTPSLTLAIRETSDDGLHALVGIDCALRKLVVQGLQDSAPSAERIGLGVSDDWEAEGLRGSSGPAVYKMGSREKDVWPRIAGLRLLSCCSAAYCYCVALPGELQRWTTSSTCPPSSVSDNTNWNDFLSPLTPLQSSFLAAAVGEGEVGFFDYGGYPNTGMALPRLGDAPSGRVTREAEGKLLVEGETSAEGEPPATAKAQRKKALFADSDKDFVDVLFIFLTMPMGTIVRLLAFSVSSLSWDASTNCTSVEDLTTDFFQTKACKGMLLAPLNAASSHCYRLKINIDDTKTRAIPSQSQAVVWAVATNDVALALQPEILSAGPARYQPPEAAAAAALLHLPPAATAKYRELKKVFLARGTVRSWDVDPHSRILQKQCRRASPPLSAAAPSPLRPIALGGRITLAPPSFGLATPSSPGRTPPTTIDKPQYAGTRRELGVVTGASPLWPGCSASPVKRLSCFYFLYGVGAPTCALCPQFSIWLYTWDD
ncbi:hypothetical protein HU200_017093 [Digitaria exilis]|uniref:Uncharacterized protein n=1 Tax=Digitaria exilis TaxID=1010633 RepID=A0A835F738_9POAL|nr:hypothetical protein HU200_017093 [Digitaria exilis]